MSHKRLGPVFLQKREHGLWNWEGDLADSSKQTRPIPFCSHTEVWTRCSLPIAILIAMEPQLHTGPRWCHHFCCLIIVSNVVMWSILLLRWIIRQQLNFVTIESSGSDHGDEKHLLSRVRCAKLQYNFRSSVTNWKLEYFFQSDYWYTAFNLLWETCYQIDQLAFSFKFIVLLCRVHAM